MPKQELKAEAHADSIGDSYIRCIFPDNSELTTGKLGRFRVLKKITKLGLSRAGATPLLRSIFVGLEKEISRIHTIYGDRYVLHIRLSDPSAVDNIVMHLALACRDHQLAFSYDCGQKLTTVQPAYAV